MNSSILLFFNISGGELAVIALIIFIVLGPDKIPDIARKFGKTMRYIRRATDEIKREINIDEDLIQKPRSNSYTKKTAFIGQGSESATENAQTEANSKPDTDNNIEK